MRPRALTLVAVLALCPSVASSAFAQDAASDAVYERANGLRRRRHDARALDLLREHFERTHEPRAQASMGLARMALGRWNDAERDLVAALGAPAAPWIDANRAALESAVQQCRAQMGVGALLVRSETPGAEVFVNGARVGAVGQAIRVSTGTVAYEVRAPGHVAFSGTASVTLGATVTAEIALPAIVSPVVTAPSPVAVAAVPPVTLPVTATPAEPTIVVSPPGSRGVAAPATRPSMLRPLAWAGLVGATTFVGAGVVTYVVGAGAADRWNSPECLAPGRTRLDVCGDEKSTATTMGALATAGFVTGFALAVTSAVLFVVSGSSRATERLSLRCGPGPGVASAMCAVEF